jgi:hypothetical protein
MKITIMNAVRTGGVEKPKMFHEHQKYEKSASQSYVPVTIPLSH